MLLHVIYRILIDCDSKSLYSGSIEAEIVYGYSEWYIAVTKFCPKCLIVWLAITDCVRWDDTFQAGPPKTGGMSGAGHKGLEKEAHQAEK
jgi:hypothetical protein